jgi:lactobin A/cerein 7B family class IIb bacteriocin
MNNLKTLTNEEMKTTNGGLILAWLAYKAIKGAYEKGYDDAQEKCICQPDN